MHEPLADKMTHYFFPFPRNKIHSRALSSQGTGGGSVSACLWQRAISNLKVGLLYLGKFDILTELDLVLLFALVSPNLILLNNLHSG